MNDQPLKLLSATNRDLKLLFVPFSAGRPGSFSPDPHLWVVDEFMGNLILRQIQT
jgi:hypothetical protein